jgi:hypothetical protein
LLELSGDVVTQETKEMLADTSRMRQGMRVVVFKVWGWINKRYETD